MHIWEKTLNFLIILHKTLMSTNITEYTKYAFSSATSWLTSVIESVYLGLVNAQGTLKSPEI